MGSGTISKLYSARRVTFEKTISGGGDVTITKDEIATAANISSGKLFLIIPEGARPTTTWGCVPTLFWNSSRSSYGVHNTGTSTDTISISFGVLFYL